MKRVFWSSQAVRFAMVGALAWCGYAAVVLATTPPVLHTDTALDATLAFVLGLLMAVRINRAYERWWEGRTLWGTLVNASRNLAVKVRTFARPEPDEAARVHALISAFAYGLRDHLRKGARLDRLPGFEAGEVAGHVPSAVVSRLYGCFRDWTESKRITPHELRMLDLEGRILLDVAGGCERIRNTSLPPALTWVTRVAVTSALLLAPLAASEEFGWWIVPIAGVVAFLVIVAETIAFSLEHPFGTEYNQLDLTEISMAIEKSTGEILGVD
jgi:putative membrane protein